MKRVGGADPEAPSSADDVFFEVAWIPEPVRPRAHGLAPSAAGDWLLFADEDGMADALVQQIEACGGTCTVVRSGEARRLSEAVPYRGVIYLSGLDADRRGDAQAPALEAETVCLGALRLIQELAKLPGRVKPQLWVVTRGAQAVDATPGFLAVAQAPLLGLARSADLEHPELRLTRIDLDPEREPEEMTMLVEDLTRHEPEHEVAYRRGGRRVPRLVRQANPAFNAAANGVPRSPSFRLEIVQPRRLDGLALRPASRAKPKAAEVEIQVRAAGLNFRDVMNATGLYPGAPIALGAECAGTITAVGPGVEEFGVGAEVIAIVSGSFAAFAIADSRAVVRKPAGLSWDAAATIPVAFLTAHYALNHLARLASGERVLIHGAAGGVGLAAVQIARRAGAEIFATAGTPEKRAYLRAMGVEHAMDSRSLAFAEEVMSATGGRGVDVVLNSLPGEYAAKSLALLGAYGRFVEIGKTDIYQNKPMGLLPFRNNLSYFAFDLERVCRERPALVRAHLLELVELFRRGALQALPLESFSITEAVKAFRYMAGRKNLGKVVLSFPEADPAPVSQGRRTPFSFRADSTYLITGGLGGLGLTVARWMVEKGARPATTGTAGPPRAIRRPARRRADARNARRHNSCDASGRCRRVATRAGHLRNSRRDAAPAGRRSRGGRLGGQPSRAPGRGKFRSRFRSQSARRLECALADDRSSARLLCALLLGRLGDGIAGTGQLCCGQCVPGCVGAPPAFVGSSGHFDQLGAVVRCGHDGAPIGCAERGPARTASPVARSGARRARTHPRGSAGPGYGRFRCGRAALMPRLLAAANRAR